MNVIIEQQNSGAAETRVNFSRHSEAELSQSMPVKTIQHSVAFNAKELLRSQKTKKKHQVGSHASDKSVLLCKKLSVYEGFFLCRTIGAIDYIST